MNHPNTQNPLEALQALTARVDSSREVKRQTNRENFPELAAIADKTGGKLVWAISDKNMIGPVPEEVIREWRDV